MYASSFPWANDAGSLQAANDLIADSPRLALIGGISRFSSAALLWWDHLITLDQEVEEIWNRPKGLFTMYWVLMRCLPTILKTAVLYADFVVQWTPAACRQFSILTTFTNGVIVMLVHFSFVLRVYALYSRSLKAVAIPTALLAAQFGSIVVLLHDAAQPHGYIHSDVVCMPVVSFAHITVTLGLSLLFDCVIIYLILWKCHSLQQKWDGRELLVLIVRDGVGYFVAVVVGTGLTILILWLNHVHPAISSMLIMMASTAPIIFVTRMILALRQVAASGGRERTILSDNIEPEDPFRNQTFGALSVVSTSAYELFDVEPQGLRRF